MFRIQSIDYEEVAIQSMLYSWWKNQNCSSVENISISTFARAGIRWLYITFCLVRFLWNRKLKKKKQTAMDIFQFCICDESGPDQQRVCRRPSQSCPPGTPRKAGGSSKLRREAQGNSITWTEQPGHLTAPMFEAAAQSTV